MWKNNVLITDFDYSCTDKSFEYLIWFQPSIWGIVFNELEIYIILDWRYFEKTKNIDEDRIKKILKNKDLKITFIKSGDIIESVIKVLSKNDLKIVFEWKIAWEYIEKIEKKLNKKSEILKWWYFTENRILKTEEEKEKIKKAIEIIDKVFLHIEELNEKWKIEWMTELEVRWIITSKIFEFWWEWESFDSIVAFWEKSAIPHCKAWNTKIWNGVLLIDMWALYKWYCSDFTRTLWIWAENAQYKKFKEVYDIVKNAHNNAFLNGKAWMTWKEIDFLTRNYIEKKWYWENFIHWTGHWVWLNLHEYPRIKKESEDNIENDMIFTIEPWIYLKDNFWIRLEDIVIMENWSLIKYTKSKI